MPRPFRALPIPSVRGGAPRVWPAVFIAQCAGALALMAVLALGAGIDITPSSVPGNAVFAPWPVTSLGSGVAAVAWGVVVASTIALLLRPMLADQPHPPSLVPLVAAVAVGGYVPLLLAGGLTRGDPQNGATLPAIVLTSVLVRLATRTRPASRSTVRTRPRRLAVAAALVLALAVAASWAAFHPVQVGEVYVTYADGSSETSPAEARRALMPGAGQRIDVAIETVGAVRLLDVRPVVPDELRAVSTRGSDASARLPRVLRAGDGLSLRFRLGFRRCGDRSARVGAVRVRFVRLDRTISQTLPLHTPLTLRCERAAR